MCNKNNLLSSVVFRLSVFKRQKFTNPQRNCFLNSTLQLEKIKFAKRNFSTAGAKTSNSPSPANFIFYPNQIAFFPWCWIIDAINGAQVRFGHVLDRKMLLLVVCEKGKFSLSMRVQSWIVLLKKIFRKDKFGWNFVCK